MTIRLFNKNPVLIMISLLDKDKTASEICYERKIPHNYIIMRTAILKNFGLIKIKKFKNRNLYSLTEEGRELAELLKKVYERCEYGEDSPCK
jgi:predicted transcriptional regulator